MWLTVVLAASFSVMHWLLSLLADGWLAQLALFVLYMSATEWLQRSGRLFVPAARDGWLARFVHKHAPVLYPRSARERLKQLARTERQLMFCLAPHGPMCLGMAIGFAGHYGQIPVEISDRLLIVGHWSIRLIPFVRELAAAFGIISSLRAPVDEALAAGRHLALIPCGMDSKMQSLVDAPVAPNTIVVHRQRNRLGFLALAARHNLLVVPVLAPDENNLYSLHGTSLGLWWLTLPLGRHLLLPRRTLTLRFGTPIDPAQLGHSVERLETAYYSALSQLAVPTHRVEYRYID